MRTSAARCSTSAAWSKRRTEGMRVPAPSATTTSCSQRSAQPPPAARRRTSVQCLQSCRQTNSSSTTAMTTWPCPGVMARSMSTRSPLSMPAGARPADTARLGLYRRSARTLRVHGQAWRPGSAFHAFCHGAGGADGTEHRRPTPRAGLRDRNRPGDHARPPARARPGRRLRPQAPVPGRDQDDRRAPGRDSREPQATALGATADLRCAVLPRGQPGRDRPGARVLRRRQPVRGRTAAGLRR